MRAARHETVPLPVDDQPESQPIEGHAEPATETTDSTETDLNTPDTSEPAVAERQDQEIRYQDVELLGRRYSVLRVINENSVQAAQNFQDLMIAKHENLRETPGKLKEKLLHSIAEASYQRKQAKYDEVAHLGDGSFLKKRRLARLQKAERRRDIAKLRLEERTTRMENRLKTVENNAEKRQQEYIAELKSKRDAAMGRKALRHELRAQGAGRLEARSLTKEVVASMPREHLARVGDLATRAHAGRRFARQAERAEAKAIKQERSITEDIANNAARQEQYAREAREAHETARDIRDTHLPAAEKRVEDLKTELADLPADDPNRENVAVQLQEAEEKVKIYRERELPYWQATAKKNEAYVIHLGEQREALKQKLAAQKESLAAKSEASDKKHAAAEQHQTTASTEAQRIINGETETGE